MKSWFATKIFGKKEEVTLPPSSEETDEVKDLPVSFYIHSFDECLTKR